MVAPVGGGERIDRKGHERTFSDDDNVLRLDSGCVTQVYAFVKTHWLLYWNVCILLICKLFCSWGKSYLMGKKDDSGTSLVAQWLELRLPVQGVQVQVLISELRSHKRHSQKPEYAQQKQCCNKFNKDFTNGPHQKKKKDVIFDAGDLKATLWEPCGSQ